MGMGGEWIAESHPPTSFNEVCPGCHGAKISFLFYSLSTRVPKTFQLALKRFRRHVRQTIRDVSDRAGVSVATVSNVLNAPHLVAPQTRTRVMEAVEALGYRPNRAARSLQARKTQRIGYRLPDPGPQAALDIFLHQLVATATNHEFDLTLFAPRSGQDDLDAYREVIRSGDVDGFVLSETNYADPRVELLSDLGFPFAAFGRANHPSPFPWVDVDGAAGLAEVVEHLAALGHERIALIAWPEGSESGDQRVEGFERGMAAAGLTIDPRMVKRVESGFVAGKAAGAELLGGGDPPSAIVTVQDEFGFGAMAAVSEKGLRPGIEIAVTGFDDTPAAAFVSPGLTTVRQPFDMVAQALVNLLVDRLENPEGTPGSSMLLPKLVIRGSTTGSDR
jgi:DNA-binding LacI/PurR family transcriptional regulator